MVGVEPVVEIAHALETLLRAADRSGGQLSRGAVEISIQAVQAIGERVRAVADGQPPEAAPEALLVAIANMDLAVATPVAPPPIAPEWDARLSLGERQQLYQALRAGRRVWALSFGPSAAHTANGVSIASVRGRLAELGEIIKVAPRTQAGGMALVFDILVISDAAPAVIAEAGATTPASLTALIAPPEVASPPASEEIALVDPAAHLAALGRAVVRVELSRLDELQEQLSLLIVSRFRLDREIAAQADRGVDVRGLREIAELQARQLRDLRRAILRVRMVRVSEVLEPLALLVRSLARPGHKEVRLEIDANETEVDKAVADRLLPALVHLVRNAIDHAIEPVDERIANNKDRAGLLRVSCRERGGSQLELVISDDGRGIDRAAIGRRAKRSVEADDDLLDVLTTPGFSTTEAATHTSGRGLGMDIVKRVTVGELGGELWVSSVARQGTQFRLKVPLTIAIIDVFAFACGPESYVVPVAAIEEIFELAREFEVIPPASADRLTGVSLIERRGQAIPVISLCETLEIGVGDARKAIVIRRNGELIAFAVDRMLGRHEVVVRPIADVLVRVPGISGATDLGDGRPTLMLDLFELGARIAVREGRV
jgi:two-component system chemotaxis sensor kinase CheA